MTNLKRNLRAFYYCLYSDSTPILDENGNETGENIVTYSAPVQMLASISPATGQSNTEQFGNLDNYDKVIVTTDMNCPIDENSVLFIDKVPDGTQVTTHTVTGSNALYGSDLIVSDSVEVPKYDYIVRRVAKSLNVISIAVRKVNVS